MSLSAAHVLNRTLVVSEDQPRIGPNAITRVAEALTARLGADVCGQVFAAAGLRHHLRAPPTQMVPDEDVALLHAALIDRLGSEQARHIAAEAGRLTALYLLENRIPRFAQKVLGLLPARFGLKLLLKALGGHAWTFAGAGTFSYHFGPEVELSVAGGPVSRHIRADEPVCAYYAATFETLFRTIISSRISVVETACEAQGAEACVFAVRVA